MSAWAFKEGFVHIDLWGHQHGCLSRVLHVYRSFGLSAWAFKEGFVHISLGTSSWTFKEGFVHIDL